LFLFICVNIFYVDYSLNRKYSKIHREVDKMNKFEYCYLTTGRSYEDLYTLKFSKGQSSSLTGKLLSDVLDQLGKDGWEIVGFDSLEGGNFIFFKRELGDNDGGYWK
jgi:hypothetical protein